MTYFSRQNISTCLILFLFFAFQTLESNIFQIIAKSYIIISMLNYVIFKIQIFVDLLVELKLEKTKWDRHNSIPCKPTKSKRKVKIFLWFFDFELETVHRNKRQLQFQKRSIVVMMDSRRQRNDFLKKNVSFFRW